MEVYCVFMIIHSIEHHLLHSIHQSEKTAKEEARRKQNEISVEVIEFYVEKRQLEE